MRDTDKWYAVIMNVPRDRIGVEGDGEIDIMNVKCEPDLYSDEDKILLEKK